MSDTSFYEILKYLIPQMAILGLVYLFLDHWLKKENLLLFKKRKDDFNQLILPNKVHAFERMVLFLERISPNNIIPRLNQQGLTAQEFQFILTQDIANEYEHNLSQQLYIPSPTWKLITLAKDQMIQEIMQVASILPNSATSKELAYKIIEENMSRDKKVNTQEVIDILKKELYTVPN